MDLSFPPTNQVLSSDGITRFVQSYSRLHQNFVTEWIMKRSVLKPRRLGSFVFLFTRKSESRFHLVAVKAPSCRLCFEKGFLHSKQKTGS